MPHLFLTTCFPPSTVENLITLSVLEAIRTSAEDLNRYLAIFVHHDPSVAGSGVVFFHPDEWLSYCSFVRELLVPLPVHPRVCALDLNHKRDPAPTSPVLIVDGRACYQRKHWPSLS